MKNFLSLLVLIFVVAASTITIASDTVERIIENKVTTGLTNIGNKIAEIIPGEGDTEVTISEQDNYDIKFSILAVRPLVKNPYKTLGNEHLYFTQLRLSSHEPFANGDERTLVNSGIGFRTLVNNIIAGEATDQTLLSGFVDGVTEASAEIMNPFISESIWTEAVTDIVVRGGRTSEGRQLYTDQTPAGDKAAIKFLHLGIALAPSYRQFQRLGQAAFGVPTKRGDELNIGPELAGFMGLRPIKVNPLDSMGFKIAEYQTGIRNARREFTGGYFGILRGGRIKPNDVIQAYYNSNRARFLVQQEMNKNISAAQILGVNKSALQTEFKDRQISDSAFNNLARGRFEPYFPSEDIQQRFAEIARNLGDPNIFTEVRPTLRLMLQEFRRLPLTSVFDSDVNDFLFEEALLPPLPSTPQPVVNTQTTAQQIDPNTNLTRTQQALLSPEEQVIASRRQT